MDTQGKTKLVAIVDDDDSMRSALQGLLQSAEFPAQSFAWNFRSRISGASERRTVQDSNYFHHGAWRRENAYAGIESWRGGVHGKAVQRRSTTRECSSRSGELSLLMEACGEQGGRLWELQQHSDPSIRTALRADSSRS